MATRRRVIAPDELIVDAPEPPDNQIREAMLEIARILIDLPQGKFLSKIELCRLHKRAAQSVGTVAAAKWAVKRHVTESRVEIEQVESALPGGYTEDGEFLDGFVKTELMVKATDAMWPWWREQECVPATRAIRLSDTEQKIVDLLREKNSRQTQKEILDGLSNDGQVASEGTTRVMLAALVRHGLLTQGKDSYGSGYGLPEWD